MQTKYLPKLPPPHLLSRPGIEVIHVKISLRFVRDNKIHYRLLNTYLKLDANGKVKLVWQHSYVRLLKNRMGNLEDSDAKVSLHLVMFYCLDNADGEGEERRTYSHANVLGG
jgi:hypothetical protein